MSALRTFLDVRIRMNILIAEDDRVSRTLLREILASDRSYEIAEAADGTEAWSRLEKGAVPDLCILDIIMPGLDGLEVLKRIRADDRLRGVKVILCTARNDRTSVTEAAALSVNHFIIKPYSSRTVLEQVRKVRNQLGGQRRVDAKALVCARLGIDSSTYGRLLQLLLEDAEAVAQAVSADSAGSDPKGPLVRLNALKGASMNLGANHVVAMLSSLELELSAEAPVEAGDVAGTSSRQARIGEKLDSLKAELAQLATEAERN